NADDIASHLDNGDNDAAPPWYTRPEARTALTARDITTVYQILYRSGVSQREIARRTGQSQSEVSDILRGGRQVRDVEVLERIADGLGVPRPYLRLLTYAPDETGAYPETEGGLDSEGDEAVKRRALIAATSLAALGEVVKGMGEVAELALPRSGDEPLPSRLTTSHVHAVEAVTQQLRNVTRQYGGQAGLFGAAARHYTRWMAVPATDEVRARLGCALAELHTEAGWACHDAGMDGTGFFSRALRLADKAGDAYGIANAAWHAGIAMVRQGHPDGGLKVLQLGQSTLAGFQPGKATAAILRTDDPRVPTLTARLNRDCATAYAAMNDATQAQHWLAKAHDGWAPRNAFERAGMDLTTALIQIDLHRLDTAEHFAASAVRTYGDTHGCSRAMSGLTLAELHVRTGEPRGLAMANSAIDAVAPLHSVRARQRLEPLIAALEARPGSDHRELARKAGKVAMTRA
ncbi:MAG: helix-turn-helix domain-containing protein, partial [Pseudonocardiaceae bacterium]